MPRRSAGLVMYRKQGERLEVLTVHPGGPFWQKKDIWFIPKGEIEPGEDELAAARREFQEETGLLLREELPLIDLGEIRQKSGKAVRAWAFQGDCDPNAVHSNSFEMEWPPRSGRMPSFPEIDGAAFMDMEQAREKVHPPEFVLIERLAAAISDSGRTGILT